MMQRLRLLVLGIVGFLGVFFAHGSWLNRLLAFTLCGVLSADSGLCMAQIAKFSGQANATTPILLSQRSSEFDDPPDVSPSNNPQAPPFPLDAGPNFIRPDFANPNSTQPSQPPQPPQNNSNQQPLQNNDQAANYPPYVGSSRQVSSDTFEFELSSPEGCKFITTFKKESDSLRQDLIKFVSPNTEICGSPSSTTLIKENGSRLETKIDGSLETLISEVISERTIRLTYINAQGVNSSREFDVQPRQEQSLAQNKVVTFTPATCKALNDVCSKIGLATGVFSVVEAIAAPFLVLAGPVYAAYKAASLLANFGCWYTFGGIPPLSPTGGNTIMENMANASLDYANGVFGATGATGLPNTDNRSQYSGLTGWLDKPLNDFRNKTGFNPCGETPPTPAPPQPSGPLKQGRSYGDPHIATFDGYGYSFQTIGEFILVQSKDGAFQVQTRQGQVPGRQMSLNTGVAMKVGNSKVSIYSKDFPDGNADHPVWVDDRPVAVERTLELPGGGSIQGGDGYYTIQFPTGERVIISRLNVAGISFMNVNPGVPEQADRYIGLLGNLNNNKDDDLQTRDGRVIPSKNNSTYGAVRQLLGNLGPIPLPLSQLETAFFDQLYKEFGDSWRVTQAESLFTYAPNQSTDTFTNRNFPNSYASLASLLPADIRRAEQICQQAGVPGDLLEGCLFDVAATGEGGFVQAALDNVLDQVRDRVQNEIRNLVPVPIPLPF